jgi:hypothetical protein
MFERAYASALGAWNRVDRLKARPAHPAGPAVLVSESRRPELRPFARRG